MIASSISVNELNHFIVTGPSPEVSYRATFRGWIQCLLQQEERAACCRGWLKREKKKRHNWSYKRHWKIIGTRCCVTRCALNRFSLLHILISFWNPENVGMEMITVAASYMCFHTCCNCKCVSATVVRLCSTNSFEEFLKDNSATASERRRLHASNKAIHFARWRPMNKIGKV